MNRTALNGRQRVALWLGIATGVLLVLFTLPQHAAGFDPLAGGYDAPHNPPYFGPLLLRLGLIAVATAGLVATLADRPGRTPARRSH